MEGAKMCEEYNGWSNRETWAANLWIDNDQSLHYTVQELAQNAIKDKADDGKTCVTCLADEIESMFDDAFSDIAEMTAEGLTMLKDIGSLYRVDWHEIAQGILGEIELQAVQS
jgi:hypothetical protein